VRDVKFLGDVARLEVGVEGFDDPLKVRVREMEGWTRGAEVRVAIDPGRVLIFPAET
jgi:iron(III) transport system ATP-binding protein